MNLGLQATAFGLAILAGSASLAGEILINDSSSAKRNEQAARQLGERARQQTGQAGAEGVVYVLDPATGQLVPMIEPSQAERLRREARNRIDPATSDTAGEGAPAILHAAPLSEAERLRLKARAYTPPPQKNSPRHCGTASNSVGTIGEGAGAHKSENVVEKGGAAVNTNCR